VDSLKILKKMDFDFKSLSCTYENNYVQVTEYFLNVTQIIDIMRSDVYFFPIDFQIKRLKFKRFPPCQLVLLETHSRTQDSKFLLPPPHKKRSCSQTSLAILLIHKRHHNPFRYSTAMQSEPCKAKQPSNLSSASELSKTQWHTKLSFH